MVFSFTLEGFSRKTVRLCVLVWLCLYGDC